MEKVKNSITYYSNLSFFLVFNDFQKFCKTIDNLEIK